MVMLKHIVGESALLSSAPYFVNFLWHLTIARAGKFMGDADTAGTSWDGVNSRRAQSLRADSAGESGEPQVPPVPQGAAS